MVVGLLDNESPDSNRLTLVTPKSENDVRLQATLGSQNPIGLPVGVVSKHDNGEYTFYSNMEEMDVDLNDEVVQSQVIGTSTSLGSFDNNHVHFSIINHSGDCVGDIVDKVVCLEE